MFDPPATVPAGAETSGVQVTFTYDVDDGRGGTDAAVVTVDVVAALAAGRRRSRSTTWSGRCAPATSLDRRRAGQRHRPRRRAGRRWRRRPPIRSATRRSTIDPATGVATITAGAETSEHRYTITDAAGLSASALVTVIVADNLAPTVAPLEVETAAGQPVTIDDRRPGHRPRRRPRCSSPAATTPAAARPRRRRARPAPLVATFTPDTGFAGRASFSYTVDDQHGHVVVRHR